MPGASEGEKGKQTDQRIRLYVPHSLLIIVKAQDKRKDSWARLNNFNSDAPLSQVVQLINSAQARSSNAVAKDLQKALEMMFSSDLFVGMLKTSSPNFDPTTADLIGGLMTVSFVHSAYNEWNRISTVRDKPALLTNISSMPPEIAKCLENYDSWDYDVLALERVTEKKPLVYLAMRVFRNFNVMGFLRCTDQVMANWLQVIEGHYRPSNFYHNSTHAADVMQSSSVLLLKDNIRVLPYLISFLQEVLDPIDEVAMLLAAVIHDVDHPGRTNPFLVNSGHELAILYNDL
ncbi:High affinity cAMP-specific and IBMX-insensitive 3',5'-cyclic phosphodiesterase 8A [Cichlidogyrus casuarinus]|uniref:High affinity cAMP-specific and IBMX-insensitive 3',5'-cyclic phosphodiesterase 8A n=1 Tax=Cichlidogyrus casuarinus TaxID=1844966 RepID=A0ABD2QK29_9PLAT